jgi:mono/diheme cytochrome c family protein
MSYLFKCNDQLVNVLLLFLLMCFSKCTVVKNEEESSILMASNTRPLTDVKFESTRKRLERGEYLANGILKCFVCHSPRNTSEPGFPPIEAKKGAGAILWETESSRMVAPNITPDQETGAGSWTDDMFARAIREGIGHDGRALSLPMYWATYRELSDEDVASVVVYLRTLKPVRNKLPKRKLSAKREEQLQASSRPLNEPVKEQDLSELISRGRHLVRVADCVGCHTSWYKRNPGFFGGGNALDRMSDTSVVFSTNITPDATGLKGWTPELFIQVMRTGKSGVLDPVMPWVAYRNMNDEDLKAIFLALQDLPAVNHKVINGIEASFCEICEQHHGYGKHNKIKPLIAVAFDEKLYPDFVGTYVHPDGFTIDVTLKESTLMISEGGESLELIPVGDNRFEALGFSTPVSFRRNESGTVQWLVSYWVGEDVFERQDEHEANN